MDRTDGDSCRSRFAETPVVAGIDRANGTGQDSLSGNTTSSQTGLYLAVIAACILGSILLLVRHNIERLVEARLKQLSS